MPFTFSHPAAILPATLLPKKYYSLTGLIAGSVAPDFEYFIRMSIYGEYGHTFAGIFWFNLPLAIILAWAYHGIVRDPLIDNLPKYFQSRLSQFQTFKWSEYVRKNWAIVMVSIIMGTATHLLWDSFTHQTGYMVSLIPVLVSNIYVFNFKIPVYEIIQHGSTVVGGVIMLLYIHTLPQFNLKVKNEYIGYWWMIFTITLSMIGFRFILGLEYELINSVIISGMSGAMLSLVVTPGLSRGMVKMNKR
jgi:hypothetical protein